MNSLQQMTAVRHAYRLKGWQRALYTLLGSVVAVAGAFLAVLFAKQGPHDAASIVAPLLFLGMGLYLVLLALRARLVIEGTRIEVRDAFRERSADLSEIEGFRTVRTRNSSYTQLCLKEGRGKIKILTGFKTDDAYSAWLQQLTNLDEQDRKALLDEIARADDLGATPEERLGAVKRAKAWAIGAIVVACAAAVGLNFGDAAWRVPAAAVLALAPIIALFQMRRFPLLYTILKKKSDPRADLSGLLLASSFGLMFRVRGIEFVSVKPLLFLIIAVAIIYIAAFYTSAGSKLPIVSVIALFLVFGGIYGYGLAVVADTQLDHSQAATYAAAVIGKHATHGKSTTYYLDLAPWGPLTEANEISVPSSLYRDATPGDQVCLDLRPGFLHAPWYQRVDCQVQPDSGAQQ